MKPNCVCYVFRLCFTKGHFPKLAECAHFHYENVDFGTIQVKSSKLLLLPSKSKHTYPKWWRIQAVGWTDCPQSSVFAFKMLMGSCCMRLQHRGCQSLSRRNFKLWKRLFARVIPPWCWVRNGKMMFIKTQSMTHVSLQIDVKLNSCVFFPLSWRWLVICICLISSSRVAGSARPHSLPRLTPRLTVTQAFKKKRFRSINIIKTVLTLKYRQWPSSCGVEGYIRVPILEESWLLYHPMLWWGGRRNQSKLTVILLESQKMQWSHKLWEQRTFTDRYLFFPNHQNSVLGSKELKRS